MTSKTKGHRQRGQETRGYVQQRQLQVAVDARLELDLDVQVQIQSQAQRVLAVVAAPPLVAGVVGYATDRVGDAHQSAPDAINAAHTEVVEGARVMN